MKELYDAAFEKFLKTYDRNFSSKDTGVRLSESGYNPIYRLLKARGVFVPRPFDRETLFKFYKGKVIEQDYLRAVRDTMGYHYNQFRREEKVETPWWDEGHIDAYCSVTQTLLEVKTTAHFSGLPTKAHIRQVQAYLLFHKRAKRAELHYINSATGEREVYPVLPDPSEHADIMHILAQIHKGVDNPDIPADELFADMKEAGKLKDYVTPVDFWQWLKEQDDFQDVFTNYFSEEEQRWRRHAERLAQRYVYAREAGDDKAKGEIREQLIPYFSRGMDTIILNDGTRVSASETERITFSLKKAEKCGFVVPEQWKPFYTRKPGWIVRVMESKEIAA